MPTPVHHSRPGGCGIQPASMPEARQLNEFLYMSEGLSSSYLVVTREGRVVINTGMGFEAPVHKRNYDAVDAGPVRYILLTQAHVDHVGGVDLFREEGTEIVAHEGNQAYQDEDALLRRVHGGRSSFAFAATLAKAAEYGKTSGLGSNAQARPTPTLTFSDRYDFELGGIRFELLHVPGGETTESMAVWLPQHRICLAGNLFSALFGHVPNLVTIRGDRYRDALAFIDSLERVLALAPERLLVGHGPPIEGADVTELEGGGASSEEGGCSRVGSPEPGGHVPRHEGVAAPGRINRVRSGDSGHVVDLSAVEDHGALARPGDEHLFRTPCGDPAGRALRVQLASEHVGLALVGLHDRDPRQAPLFLGPVARLDTPSIDPADESLHVEGDATPVGGRLDELDGHVVRGEGAEVEESSL